MDEWITSKDFLLATAPEVTIRPCWSGTSGLHLGWLDLITQRKPIAPVPSSSAGLKANRRDDSGQGQWPTTTGHHSHRRGSSARPRPGAPAQQCDHDLPPAKQAVQQNDPPAVGLVAGSTDRNRFSLATAYGGERKQVHGCRRLQSLIGRRPPASGRPIEAIPTIQTNQA